MASLAFIKRFIYINDSVNQLLHKLIQSSFVWYRLFHILFISISIRHFSLFWLHCITTIICDDIHIASVSWWLFLQCRDLSGAIYSVSKVWWHCNTWLLSFIWQTNPKWDHFLEEMKRQCMSISFLVHWKCYLHAYKLVVCFSMHI